MVHLGPGELAGQRCLPLSLTGEGRAILSPRRRILTIVATTVAVLVLASAGLYRLARSRTTQLFGRLVARVETPERVVALTFDDGPTAQRVEELIAALESKQVRATFFVTGNGLAEAPEAGRRLVAAGHQLGNHTYAHQRMVLRSQGFYRSEIERTDLLIRAAGERGEILFRPPFCWKLVGLPWFLSRTGRTTVTWDIEPDSYREVTVSPERITAHVRERARPGSIILMHVWWGEAGSSGAACRAAIPMVIDGLRGDGYRFVTVRELLRLGR